MKKLFVLLISLAVFSSAWAGSISRGGSSFSASRSSVSSPAHSMGMSRPSVAPSYTAPARLSTLPFSPVSRFLEVQRAFASKDVPALRAMLDPDLIDQVLADLPEESTAPQLVGISYTVADISSNVISIHFQAEDRMDNTRLNETWHFSRVGGTWLLNGIDQ